MKSSNEMHWEIGRILYERKLEGKHGDGVVKRPIGVAGYQLIVPQKEFKQLISEEIKAFNDEIKSQD